MQVAEKPINPPNRVAIAFAATPAGEINGHEYSLFRCSGSSHTSDSESHRASAPGARHYRRAHLLPRLPDVPTWALASASVTNVTRSPLHLAGSCAPGLQAEPKEEIVIILDEIERVEAEARRLCFGGVIGDSALPNRTGPEIVSG
jgi:hypothetical protein